MMLMCRDHAATGQGLRFSDVITCVKSAISDLEGESLQGDVIVDFLEGIHKEVAAIVEGSVKSELNKVCTSMRGP